MHAEQLVAQRDALRRRGSQAWRLHLLSRELTSTGAKLWQVNPPPMLAFQLQENHVRWQLFKLATVRTCHGPFNAWVDMITRSKRARLDTLRPDAVGALRAARKNADRRVQLASRLEKLDHCIRVLAQRVACRSLLHAWRADAIEWRKGRLAAMRLQVGILHCWSRAAQAAKLYGLRSARQLLHRQYASGVAALRSAAKSEVWLRRRLWESLIQRALCTWLRRLDETATWHRVMAVARRRPRRLVLAHALQSWQSAVCRCELRASG